MYLQITDNVLFARVPVSFCITWSQSHRWPTKGRMSDQGRRNSVMQGSLCLVQLLYFEVYHVLLWSNWLYTTVKPAITVSIASFLWVWVQLGLFGHTHHSPSLISNELLLKSKRVVLLLLPESPSLPKTGVTLPSKQGCATQLPGPYPTTKQPHQCSPQSYNCAESHSPSEHSSSSLDSPSDSKSLSSTLSEWSKIPKPLSEPGQPGRGGYNHANALNWNHRVFSKFKVHSLRYLTIMLLHSTLNRLLHIQWPWKLLQYLAILECLMCSVWGCGNIAYS